MNFLADNDVVSLSNLNRQTLFLESDLKKNKAETLAKKLIQINPKLDINILPKKISKKNISKFLKNYNIILDCSDNFETRYLLNAYSFQKKKFLFPPALKILMFNYSLFHLGKIKIIHAMNVFFQKIKDIRL